ncbi:pentatricopeptide repeat-containing protein At4g13650-like [Lolium perenne]|uniref:pentatricopeptide repeat-containing protein At4g13650-like n=1 Tax=Lolium perenne TaxID=4522 RepID=UPI0021F54573|nr:pentatricopeptide repeat-containing protein At3g24000, mitochondrial-like [Lolium perenne]
MYSRCGSLEGFRKVQMAVSWQDQVSLNSVISGLSSLGLGNEAFEQFLEMRRHGADTDLFTFASMLKAIGSSSSLPEGRQVHALILNTGHDSDVNVQNGLISMYARRGEIGESQNVFASVQAPGLISWSSLLSGYAQHGCGKEAVEVFEQMRRLNVHLDHTTFLLVLTACSHTGLVDQGLEYFNLMRTDGFLAGAWQEQYACVVDLLARAGRLREAEFLVTDMPIETSVSVYRSLLSACQIHGNLEIAVRVSARLIELCPDDASGHWGSAAEVRESMAGKAIVKNPAWSCVEDQM